MFQKPPQVTTIPPIKKASGLTPTEKHLAKLADDTFLDLWSWPNVFKKAGKELCDLLVVCGDDVLMFSDKHIAWPDAPFELAWKRWYSRAIGESAGQIRKADLWLKKNPLKLSPVGQKSIDDGAERGASVPYDFGCERCQRGC